MEKNPGNMNDEELDKLFRESAENFSPPSAPEGAWDNFVEAKLTKKEEQKKSWLGDFGNLFPLFIRPKLSWQFVTTCLLLVAGIWFGMGQFNSSKNNLSNNSFAKDNTSNQQKDKGVILKNHPQIVDSSTQNTTLVNKKNGNISSNNLSNSIIKNNFSKFNIATINLSTKNNLINTYLDKKHSLNVKKYNNSINTNPLSNNQNRSIDSSTKNIVKSKPLLPDNYDELLAIEENEQKNKNENSNAKWQVALIGGSNLSVVGRNVSTNPGLNTGVMVQHRINKSRFSVETGVVRESMDYAVDNNDFHPDGGNVSSKMSNITGTCTMIDVPVNVRYDVVQTKKSNAFVSTGVSTVWMANQSYNYQYAGQNGNVQVNKNVSGQGKNVYAVSNVSVGYEHHFNKTAIELAPYVKIPLGSIGYGDLSLGSVGAQISIKQSF